MTKRNAFRLLGLVGTIFCIVIFVKEPSFPTSDKILVFLTFVFMMFGKAKALLGRLLPFVLLLLTYESFRGLAPGLNKHVNFLWMPHIDTWLFGRLPTIQLQAWWWKGHVQWYDFMFYLAYMMHFVLPLALALLVWRTRVKYYWQVIASYLVVSYAGFLTFLLFPAAPPWMASDLHKIPNVVHLSGWIWGALGLHDFPSIYNKISPNAVAAVPSLHAAYSTIFVIWITRLYGKKWGLLAAIYPLLIYVGTVYTGEHYAIDAILGIFYAIGGTIITAWAFKRWGKGWTARSKALRKHLQKKYPRLASVILKT